MSKKIASLALVLVVTVGTVWAAVAGDNSGGNVESYEGKKITGIDVRVDHTVPGGPDERQKVLGRIRSRVGEEFHGEVFDQDLKMLSQDYEWVDSSVSAETDGLVIHLTITPRPIITDFVLNGSSFKRRKILKEGELRCGMKYNKEEFYKSIQKIRDFYIKAGFFKVDISYTLDRAPLTDEATVQLHIKEGPKGRINQIVFEDFTKAEEKAVLQLIRVRKFNFLTSWLTGNGHIKQEMFDPDVQAMVHYFQNEGYVDAHVTMTVEERENQKVALIIHLERGEKYHLNQITFSGSSLKSAEDMEKAANLKPDQIFSDNKLKAAQESLKELYTKEGYLDVNVEYQLELLPEEHKYNVRFNVEESDKYRVGLVMVSGNYCTNKNVVYNNIDIEPGEVFDSRKLKSTQHRLMSTGYFKNANVYAVRNEDDKELDNNNYRDVMVEVNEAQTGNMSLFVGFSSTDNVFGGIDLTENNFNAGGVRSLWSEGPCSLRGGGQYLQVRGTVGAKEKSANISWLNPYFNDTLWRFGVDLNYTTSQIISDNYTFNTYGGALSATYPISPYLNYGFRWRAKNAIIHVKGPNDPPVIGENPGAGGSEQAQADYMEQQAAYQKWVKDTASYQEQQKNGGIISGIAFVMGYDSTDSPAKPRKGIRSHFDAEFAGFAGNKPEYDGAPIAQHDFPFLRFGYTNSLYYPVWKGGVAKLRGDMRFLQLLSGGDFTNFPLSERFFLGGEGSVRGYSPGKVGPLYPSGDNELSPTGGLSSFLGSFEISQNIMKPVDLFVFFDVGAISQTTWQVGSLSSSYGAGLRLDIGRQLPVVVGVGFPLGKDIDKERVQNVFFSMAGQF